MPELTSRLAAILDEYTEDGLTTTELANAIIDELGLTSEIQCVKGMDHLSPPGIIRWVTDWHALKTIPK